VLQPELLLKVVTFIDHRQEQWPEWLGTAEFTYNNKAHSSTKTSPFKANHGQDPRMGFEERKKERYAGAEKFVEKMLGVYSALR